MMSSTDESRDAFFQPSIGTLLSLADFLAHELSLPKRDGRKFSSRSRV
jgi:hypothetical protein